MTKKRKEVPSNSDSDNDHFSSFLKSSTHSTNSPTKKAKREFEYKYEDQDELQSNESGAQVFENENNENTSNKMANTSDSAKSTFSIEELTSDDEIYTFQCPENYIKQNLCNNNMDFTKLNQSITCNNEVFRLELQNLEQKFITLAVPKKTSGGSLIKMPLKGHIVIHKVVDIPSSEHKSNFENYICDKVIFPDNIKVRHPLLGVEWKAHVELAAEVIKKENYLKKKSKKTKDKSVEIKEDKLKKLKRKSNNSDIVIQKKKKKNSDE